METTHIEAFSDEDESFLQMRDKNTRKVWTHYELSLLLRQTKKLLLAEHGAFHTMESIIWINQGSYVLFLSVVQNSKEHRRIKICWMVQILQIKLLVL